MSAGSGFIIDKAGFIHTLILQPENRGKGAAIRTALAASTGDVVIVQDADLDLVFDKKNMRCIACGGAV